MLKRTHLFRLAALAVTLLAVLVVVQLSLPIPPILRSFQL